MALTPFDMEGVNRDLLAAGNPAKPDMQSILRRNARDLVLGNAILVSSVDARESDFADRMGDEYSSLYEQDTTGIKGGDFERFGAFADNHLDFMRALTKARAWMPSAATRRSARSSTRSTGSPRCPNHHRRHRKRTIFLPAYAIRPAR